MEVSYLWSDQIPEKDGEKMAVNDVAYSPDGSRLVAAVGNRVLLYRASDGELIDSLRGHKDVVYSVSFSADGTRFASGGADNVVIIWKSTGQGLLKYNHVSSIQQVKYNPCLLLLASCSESDFGFWSPDQKQVTKEKVPSRILCAAWSTDGNLFAIGMLNGLVSIRNQQAEELVKIERHGPVWCLAFVPEGQTATRNASTGTGPSVFDHADNLAIGCWDRTYAIYRFSDPNVAVVLSEKNLPYYPCAITCVNNTYMKSCYLVVTGSNKQVQIMSRDGTKLADVLSKPTDSWIWSNSAYSEENNVSYCTHTGSIHCVQLSYDSVNTLYGDKFAYRENLTEVIIHHLVIDKKVRIKCKDMIHNLYLYKNKLAVQLFDKICIYECAADEGNLDMHFRLNKQRILLSSMGQNPATRMVSNLLAVTCNHVLVAVSNVLELYGYDGVRQKIYTMEAKVTALKVDGGMDGREGVLLGLASGDVYKVYVDNAFPIHVCKRGVAVQKLDVNVYKTLLATVDVDHTLTISDMTSQEVVYTLNNVHSVCFNTEVEDLLCITNLNLTVSVVSGLLFRTNSTAAAAAVERITSHLSSGSGGSNIDIIDQHIVGTVLAYKGARIFTTSKNVLTSTDIPQGGYINKALEGLNYETAYKIACLGATENEWRILALKALRSNNLEIAKNAFAKLRDFKYLNLIETITQRQALASAMPSAAATATAATGTGATTGPSGRRHRGGATAAAPAPAANTAVAYNPFANQLEPQFQAEILAYEGHYFEAAKIYMRMGRPEEAIRIFTDLKRYNDAKTFANSLPNAQSVLADLTSQQARWLQETKDWKGAAELYCSMGQFAQAAHIIGENEGSPQWASTLLEVVRSCGADDKDTLVYCGDKLCNHEDVSLAKEAYIKAQNYNKLMALYVSKQLWNEAAKLADEYTGKFDMSVFLSYAEWLVSQEQYMEAMEAFKKCQRGDLGRRLLMELTDNAVAECRFKDAGYYYWMLAKEVEQELSLLDSHLSSLNSASSGHNANGAAPVVINTTIAQLDPQTIHVYMDRLLGVQAEYEHKADLYYAYSNIHSFVTDPFTSFQPEMLFQVSRFIINSLGVADKVPLGISKTATLYTLAKQSMQLGAFKLARSAFERLQKLFIPSKFAEIELDMLLVQAKPIRDDPDHLPVCYRCGSTNPLLNPFNNKYAKGDVCTNCGHPFVRSFINFDILPLVEFVPLNSITDEEAIDLIRQNPAQQRRARAMGMGAGNGEGSLIDGANVLTLNDDDYPSHTNRMDVSFDALDPAGGGNDLFTACLNATLEKQKSAYTPVQVDANTLLAMKRSDVFVCKPSSKNKRATFYKNMLPDIPIAISQACHRFFHLEDFEFAYLSEKKCPYSRVKNVGEYGSL